MNTGVDIAQVQVGQHLPELRVPLTRTLIVSTAIASRDYQDVHHDPGLAKERGSKDIFMNILTSNGFAERFVREWAGPEVFIRRINLRLGAPNYPGDVMVCQGEVTQINEAEQVATIAVNLTNELGSHASGHVEVRFPTQ